MRQRIRFSKKALEALVPPTEGRDEYVDTEIPQLILRVTAKGARTLAVAKKVRGESQRVRIGPFPEITVETARKRAREILQDVALGKPVEVLRVTRAPRGDTLAAELEDYIASRQKKDSNRTRTLKDSTAAEYRSAVGKVLKDWQDKPLVRITGDMVTAKLDGYPNRGRAEGAMRVLRAVWNHAAQKAKKRAAPFPPNPVEDITEAKAWEFTARRRKKTVVKEHQLPAWWKAIHGLGDDHPASPAGAAADYFVFLLMSGVRGGEASSLTWDRVDLAGRTFRLVDTKARNDVELPLSEYLAERLQRRRDAMDPKATRVFAGFDERHWRMRAAAAGEVPFTRHDLRRSFLSIGEDLDISLITLKRLSNHAAQEYDITIGYIVSDLKRMRAATERITNHILKTVGVEPTAQVIELRPAEVQ